jgi:hypothetical protein
MRSVWASAPGFYVKDPGKRAWLSGTNNHFFFIMKAIRNKKAAFTVK